MQFIRRWIVMLAVIVTLLFALPILLIRAQPYESGYLGTFLIPPDGCRAPCFMGVRPRHTTAEQALAILRANDAVEQVRMEHYYAGQSIVWNWKAAPAQFRRYAFRIGRDNLVSRPVLPSTLTLGEVQLALGQPERVTAAFTNEYLPRAAVVLDYPQHGLHLFIGLYPCQVDQTQFWRIRHESSVFGSFFIGLGDGNYARILPQTLDQLDPSSWAKQLRDFCRAE